MYEIFYNCGAEVVYATASEALRFAEKNVDILVGIYKGSAETSMSLEELRRDAELEGEKACRL